MADAYLHGLTTAAHAFAWLTGALTVITIVYASMLVAWWLTTGLRTRQASRRIWRQHRASGRKA